MSALALSDFRRLARFIEGYCGIRMPDNKRTMLEGRLRRRLAALDITDFGDYCRYLFDDHGLEHEAVHLIDAVTTNKTDFFREPEHFRILADQVAPHLVAAKPGRRLVVWSAASSVGAEAYTLAMVLDDLIRRGLDFDYTILATDICTSVLRQAAHGIYSEEMTGPVPPEFRQRYLMRARDRERRELRIVPELRAKVQCLRMNLVEDSYPLSKPADIVFCRNILIYFDKPTQGRVLERLCAAMAPGGYLFLGHSETVAGLDLPLKQVSTTVFERR